MRAFLVAVMLMLAVSPAWAGGGGHGEAKPSGPVLVPVDRLSVPIIRNGELSETFTVMLRLEVVDSDVAARVKEAMPRLASELLRDLLVLAGVPRVDEQGFDLVRAKPRLLATARRLFGKDAVRDLLVERTLSRKPA